MHTAATNRGDPEGVEIRIASMNGRPLSLLPYAHEISFVFRYHQFFLPIIGTPAPALGA